MVSLEIQKLEQDLRKRLGRFVGADSKRYYPHLYSVLEDIRNSEYPAYLCGGAVRDILLSNNSIPRDLDIIMGDVSRKKLATLFSDNAKGETSLGGIVLKIKDWMIDMWPLKDTLTIREKENATELVAPWKLNTVMYKPSLTPKPLIVMGIVKMMRTMGMKIK